MARGKRLHVVNVKSRVRTEAGLMAQVRRDPDYVSLYGTWVGDLNLGLADSAEIILNTLDYLDIITRDGEDRKIVEEIERTGRIGIEGRIG